MAPSSDHHPTHSATKTGEPANPASQDQPKVAVYAAKVDCSGGSLIYSRRLHGTDDAAVLRRSARTKTPQRSRTRPLRVEFLEPRCLLAGTPLITEFMALGNHRKSIRAEIAEVTERVRRVQLDALERRFTKGVTLPEGHLSPGALLLLTVMSNLY